MGDGFLHLYLFSNSHEANGNHTRSVILHHSWNPRPRGGARMGALRPVAVCGGRDDLAAGMGVGYRQRGGHEADQQVPVCGTAA